MARKPTLACLSVAQLLSCLCPTTTICSMLCLLAAPSLWRALEYVLYALCAV